MRNFNYFRVLASGIAKAIKTFQAFFNRAIRRQTLSQTFHNGSRFTRSCFFHSARLLKRAVYSLV
jgi:hypothetical protein